MVASTVPNFSDSVANVCVSQIVAFPSEYKVLGLLRPDVPQAESLKVQKLQRLTPESYDRNIFHLELDVCHSEKCGAYQLGDALAVYPRNSKESVDEFIRTVLLPVGTPDPTESIQRIRNELLHLPPSLICLDGSISPQSDNSSFFSNSVLPSGPSNPFVCITTVEKLLTSILDINGSPAKDFFRLLSKHAVHVLEKVRLAELTLERCEDEFKELVTDAAITHSVVFSAFPSARPSLSALCDLIPAMKPRLYSIASSSLFQPGQLDLLVVEETWRPAQPSRELNPIHPIHFKVDKMKSGLCSNYLSCLKAGDQVACSLTASTMYLPPCHKTPVVMAGLGTGMAPFRAFLQEKKYWKEKGESVGPVALYFGSRHKASEYLYGEELDLFVSEGLLTRLGCAFSRDQKEKIYIQDKIRGDGVWLARLLVAEKGHFYLCGPTWPTEDVTEALLSSFESYGGLGVRERALEWLKEMKENSRFVLEVY